jgi:hypothetical protein
MLLGPSDAMTNQQSPVDWDALDFAAFARLATDETLSKYQKIGFPDSYRSGFEAAIFEDIRAKLTKLDGRNLTVLDIGPGCSDLPAMLIDLCATQEHSLHLIDSEEMLAQLPNRPFTHKLPGMFPRCRGQYTQLSGRVDALLCYSVLHYVFVESNVFEFVDAVIELLAPAGEALIGDIPNISKRRRFFRSDAGIAFHRDFTGTDTFPQVPEPPTPGRIDDAVVLALLMRARAAGIDAYVLPQNPGLPMANRREDILLRKP